MEKKVDMKKITFRNETPADYRAVENLTREAFWNVYKPGCDEHFILHNFRTRSEFVPELDIIMEEEGILVGHVMFARAEIKLNNSKTLPIMTFGPISIAPEFKHKGCGLFSDKRTCSEFSGRSEKLRWWKFQGTGRIFY